MKFSILITALVLLLGMNGCARGRMDTVEDAVEQRVDRMEDAVENAVQSAVTPGSAEGAANILTKEEAQAIALEHAGFTADQVTYLRVEYEVDGGVPQYEVQFHQNRWEYDYEINAETGAIMSYDKDD